ncbi:hypothetical protein M426DRAFT_9359 [Hypoxylon sp. CI-4A]|nr:hypothetical protein M426DRAFT_9359 [Hypoxylon sp. CI-4A]
MPSNFYPISKAELYGLEPKISSHHEYEGISNSSRFSIPYENYIRAALRGNKFTYLILSRCFEDKDLLVYHVVNLDDEQCEAQVFIKRDRPRDKLYMSRKRRIQRLKRSANLIEEFELNEATVFVSRIPEQGIERHHHCQLAKENMGEWQEFSEKQFPPLRSPSDDQTGVDNQDSWDGCGRPSYAEAASLPRRETFSSCPVGYLSQSKEGIRQRERRREERWSARDQVSEGLSSQELWIPRKAVTRNQTKLNLSP